METVAARFTVADLREMPEDGRRYEVVEGDLYVSPAPKTRHQRISLRLSAFLERAEEAGFGVALAAPTDVYLDDANGVQPDLLFVRRVHTDMVVEDNVRGVPDLVTEILSPTTRARDLGVKLRLYARFGVRVYWVVDPEAETITVYEPAGDGNGYARRAVLSRGDTLRCDLFPGVEVEVAKVFGPR